MNFLPIAIAVRPRKLTPAFPIARVILAPSPGLSLPSMRTAWMVSLFMRPASCAALVAFAPFTGETKRIPCPGFSGVRRPNTISTLAAALARPPSGSHRAGGPGAQPEGLAEARARLGRGFRPRAPEEPGQGGP